MSKALGYKSFVTKGLKGNAEIQHDTGEVAIDFDFEREVGPVDNRQKVSIVFHAAHEIALHGVVKRAPEEGRAFVYAMYKHLAGNEPSVITLADETIDESQPYELFDPDYTWKRKTVTNYVVRELLEPVFAGGKCVYQKKSIQEIRNYCKEQVDTLWDEVTRFENPHNYYVDLSEKLWDMKHALLKGRPWK